MVVHSQYVNVCLSSDHILPTSRKYILHCMISHVIHPIHSYKYYTYTSFLLQITTVISIAVQTTPNTQVFMITSNRISEKNTNPQSINNTYDTFAQTWGATTQWKSGLSRNRPIYGQQTIPDPCVATARPVGSVQPLPGVSRRNLLDKPLPPLPAEEMELVPLRTSINSQRNSTTPVKAGDEPLKEHSPPQNSSSNQSSAESRKSSGSSLMAGAKRKSIFGFPRKKVKTLPAAPEPISMVDNGTQTTPTIERRSNLHRSLTMSHSSSNSNSPHAPRTLEEVPTSVRGVPSPTVGLRTPLWSPRSLFNNPLDYFNIPSEKIEKLTGEGSGNDLATPKASRNFYKQKSPPTPPQKANMAASMDTLGTYESRYSPRPSISQPATPRPPLIRNVRTTYGGSGSLHSRDSRELSANQRPTKEPDASTALMEKPSAPQSLPRSMPIPFQKLYPPRKSSHPQRRKSSNRSESPNGNLPSPLRQELEFVEEAQSSEVGFVRQPQNYFRVRMYEDDPYGTVSVPPIAPADVPEHLSGSPLCPMHPKHKSGGLGTCPFHGRRPSEPDTIDGEAEYDLHSTKAEEDAMGDDDAFWGDIGGVMKRKSVAKETFKLEAVKHQEGSVLCPAHPRYGGVGKGVCVYHGRAKAIRLESDDSIPRLRM